MYAIIPQHCKFINNFIKITYYNNKKEPETLKYSALSFSLMEIHGK